MWGGLLADLGVRSGVQKVTTGTGVLQSLRLVGCYLDADAFEHVAYAMMKCYTLKELECVSHCALCSAEHCP